MGRTGSDFLIPCDLDGEGKEEGWVDREAYADGGEEEEEEDG